MFPYIDFTNRMKYSSRNAFVMIPRPTMTSGHLMNISTGISGFRNSDSTSHNSATHPSSFLYKFNPMRICVDVSVATGIMALWSQLLGPAYIS